MGGLINYPKDFTSSKAKVVEDERVQTMARTLEPDVSFCRTGDVLVFNAGSHIQIYRLESELKMPERDWRRPHQVPDGGHQVSE